nr:type I pullulanase [Neobacillus sp. Marseille-Q6967]
MISSDRKFFAYLDEMKIVTILYPLSYHHGHYSAFSITDGSQIKPLKIIEKLQIENKMKYVCMLSEEIEFGITYWIHDEHGGKTDLQMGAVIRTDEFDDRFFYECNDLGVNCKNNLTEFKLWAPTATQVKLKLRTQNSAYSELIKMKRAEKGVWEVVVPRDLEFYEYTFLVLVNLEWREAVDPYARAVTVNGERGVIVKLEKTPREKRDLPPFENPVDAIIYETHIRDFSIHPDSGVKRKGLYLGAGEVNTKGKMGELTGLSYVKDLGITHIEFLPFNDFAGVDENDPKKNYNWGYNPVHFNVPEGSYSTNPANPYTRINELKQLIKNIHNEGLRVIMDVVYNHVYIREESNFEKIVPGYYFRHNEYGMPSNGTGVGNDIASERKMVRKYIVDSIRFWMEEYHIDGFRFDLMGILDIETMEEIRKTCDSISEGTLLIGEGWNLNTPLAIERKATIRNQAKLPAIAQFNDKFRDTIKGNTFNLYDKGYGLGNEHYYAAAIEVITGSIGFDKKDSRLFNEPSQSVNYVECHDNHTMWDKLQACFQNSEEALRVKYHRFATSLVLLSQGIPFLHSGQEFLRTKHGEGNSYRSPDSVNQIDWSRRMHYVDNVNYIKGIIKIRKELPCFRMRTAAEIRSHVQILSFPAPIIGLNFKNQKGTYQEILLLINPMVVQKSIRVPEGRWTIVANHQFAEISSTKELCGGEMILEPISINVLVKK